MNRTNEEPINPEEFNMIISYNLDTFSEESIAKIKTFTDDAIRNGYTVIGLSSSADEVKDEFNTSHDLNFDWFLCDEKALKTVVRSNPGILETRKGTVAQKVHWKNLDDFTLDALTNAIPNLNFDLKKQLDSVLVLDQKYRANYNPETWGLQMKIDSSNIEFMEQIFKDYGYPGKSLVGEPTNMAAWYVVQHSNRIPEYLPLIKAAAEKGELSQRSVAIMEDRYLMQNDKPQVYGTQGSSYGIGSPQEISFIWPIADPNSVNERRKAMGFDSTIEEYAKELFGDDFEYKLYSMEEIREIIEPFQLK